MILNISHIIYDSSNLKKQKDEKSRTKTTYLIIRWRHNRMMMKDESVSELEINQEKLLNVNNRKKKIEKTMGLRLRDILTIAKI